MCLNVFVLSVRAFLLLLSFSRPVCFHRNTGTDPRVCARQRRLCDPDSVQVRQSTHTPLKISTQFSPETSCSFRMFCHHRPAFVFASRLFILSLGCVRDVNTTIVEMLIMVYACRTSCARSITGVLPYFPYSKQCKMRKRGSIVSKLIASMMCKAGKFRGGKSDTSVHFQYISVSLQHHRF